MTYNEFQTSLKGTGLPADVLPLVAALWWDARGNWSRAHEIAQDIDSADGAWVHAYLHRKEGDAWNAGYWYGRAGRTDCQLSLSEEWQEITRSLLEE